jgi:hypothetical protein
MRSASEKAAAVSAMRSDVKQMELRAGAKKDFETKQSSVFAAPGLPLAHFLTAEFGMNRQITSDPIRTVSIGAL